MTAQQADALQRPIWCLSTQLRLLSLVLAADTPRIIHKNGTIQVGRSLYSVKADSPSASAVATMPSMLDLPLAAAGQVG